ncbi:unnamed protein product, partial [Porites lobata]
FRLIQHLSYSQGTSVNDNIPDAHSSVHYASISDAIAVLKSLGAGCFLAKTDIKSAFRIIPIHPSDFPLLGMKWDNQFFFDVCLPMGLAMSHRFKQFRMCDYLGVPIAQEKTCGPSQVIQFAGITLDSINQGALLPEDKLQKCRLLLESF